MLPKELQKLIDQLPIESQLAIQGLIVYFEEQLSKKDEIIAAQELRIKELENQLSKNSGNSSKPPLLTDL